MNIVKILFFLFASSLAIEKDEKVLRHNRRNSFRGSNKLPDGSWQSFPTPGPKPVKSNPNVKCQIQTFGRCNVGEYCKGISYDKYQCTKCLKNMVCTGDGRMGPSLLDFVTI